MNLCPPIVFKWFEDDNAPAQGWKLYTYIAGSSTPVDTFTDSSGASQNTNPIILDYRGEARLWLDPSVSYKLVVTTPTGDPLSPEFVQDNVTNAGGSVSGLSRVYYSDSSTIAFSGLGTLATPLSAQIKLSAYPNNALQIRPDGLYAQAIGGGGSVAWGSITGSISAQSDLIAKFGEYLPLTFASPQVLNLTGGSGSTFVFANAGQFVSQSAIDNSYLSLHPNSQKIIWQASNGTQSDLVFPSAPASARTWTLPNASGTIALTSDIPSVADYIKKDGTTTTTATIPFAVGLSTAEDISISDNKALAWSVGSTIRGTSAGNILVRPHLASSGAFDVSSHVNIFEAVANNRFRWNGTATPPTGTQAYLLAIDASGNIIQGTASSGATWGSITGTLSAQTDLQTALNAKINIAGHNDLTTPWSVGDASTWGTSGAGVQVDPVGAYGLYLKGNAIIEQAVSQALTLYRPVTSGDICLNYDAQDSLGVQASYAQVCGVVVSNTAGSVGGGLDLEVAIAGVMTPLLQLRQAGSTLSSALTISGAGCSVNTNTSDQGYVATSSAFTNGGIFLGRSSRGTIASPTALQSGDTLVFLGGQGYGATGYSSLSRAVIRFHTSEAWTDTAQGTYISFSTTPNGSTTRAERGRIENDGVLTWLNRIDTPASTTASAGLRLPHGTAPTAPVNGDVWSTTTGLLYRINGATKTSADLETAQTFASVKTFSSTPVISSTTASTTAGALYRINNGGLANYEHGMVRLTQATLYRAPVGTALTNSVTETDVNGGTAVIGTRTMSTTAFQVSAFVRVRARVKYTNTAANTLTIRLRWNTISGTILGSVTLTRVNAGAEVFDVDFVGVAQAVPGASVATSWTASVFGNSLIVTNATSAGSEATLATSTATPLILSAQWTSALATSSVQILNSQITLE